MGNTWGGALIWAFLGVVSAGFVFASPAAAEERSSDAAAREYFRAGRAAFDQADYENALTYFRHAYRVSGRGMLQYNIGVTADRLQLDREALEAFERYLEEAETLVREAEVRGRIEALKKSLAEMERARREMEAARLRAEELVKKSSTQAPVELPESAPRKSGVAYQMPEYKAAADESSAKKKKKWPWIVAAAAVAVAGGVTAGVVISQRSNQSAPSGGTLSVNW